jgi:D-lactate dehydrogenase
VKLAEGFEGISIFTTDNASDTVLENYYVVVRYIALRSVDLIMSIKKKQELWESKWQTYPRTPYSVAEHAVTIGIKSKDYSGQNSCKWATTVDHLVGFDLHGKNGIIGK